MRDTPFAPPIRAPHAGRAWAFFAAVLLASCASPPPPAPGPTPAPVEQAPAPEPTAPPQAAAPLPAGTVLSQAATPLDYRKDGALHLYEKNRHRIFKGKMPPLLQGVGVMQVNIDHRGNVTSMNWLRPPSHAGARAEIERTVLAAAPYPIPQRMGRVTYTDVWLWHESGRFQLDTLTEGQSDR